MPERATPYNGLLIVDKPGHSSGIRHPAGHDLTSHDVVALVRRWSGQRRIGHTGTLDPMASGVLALCLGRATRLVEYYQGHDKQYLADIALGAATDTYDALGEVIHRAAVPDIDARELERVLDQFRGRITQQPPAYSAIKQGGEALYHKARRGEDVQAPTRQVTISRLELLHYVPGESMQLRVVCSAGAYMRSLAHDIGLALGTFAHLAALRREAAGPFTLADGHTLTEVEAAAQADRLHTLLLPLGAGLDLPRLMVDDECLVQFGHGQQVALADDLWHDAAAAAASARGSEAGELAQAVAPDGTLAGIIRRVGSASDPDDPSTDPSIGASHWRAVKWLRTT